MIELTEFDYHTVQRWCGMDVEPEYMLEFFLWLDEKNLPDEWVLHVENWMTLHLCRSKKNG